MQYEDRRDEEQPLECEMQGEDLNGRKFKMLKIKGLPPGFAKLEYVQSGFTTLFADGSDIDDATNELLIGEGNRIQVSGLSFHIVFYEVSFRAPELTLKRIKLSTAWKSRERKWQWIWQYERKWVVQHRRRL